MSKDYVAHTRRLAAEIKKDHREIVAENRASVKKYVAAVKRMKNRVVKALQPFNGMRLRPGKVCIESNIEYHDEYIKLIHCQRDEDDDTILHLIIYPSEIEFYTQKESFTSIEELLEFIATYLSAYL